ncbi:MAG: ABC transporter ATP-binding protein [Chloroflexi bacterium]|nr:ABC transporter ATP-binding protein [Chloroflexota bacterium]
MSRPAPVVEMRGVVKTFEDGRVRALDGVDFTVLGGEFIAVVGPSGCGKSTLLHLIAALERPDEGTIVVNAEDLALERDLCRHRAREVGLVFQLDNLLPTLSASENVQVPMFEIGLSASQRRTRAQELLALVDLTGKAKNRPAELSGGERQRVAIARALANEPGILLMDEPTGRLDSASGRRVLDLVEELRRRRGLTIILVTHDAGIAARADRIVRMLDGKMVGAEARAGHT